jgi:PAS domain S-box-containing protein
MEEERLKRTHGLERFFTLSADLFAVADFEGYFTILNPAWEQIVGHSTEELLSTPYLDFIHHEDRDATFVEISRLAQGISSTMFVNRFWCKDGRYKWLRWSCTSDLSRGEIYAVARDVTEVERTNEALRHAYQTLNSIFSASPHAIIAVDRRRNVRVWNPAATAIFGWTDEEVIGRRVPFVTDETRADSERLNERGLQGEHFANLEVRRHRRDGTPVDLFVSAAPTYDADGSIDGFLTVATDVTEHKKLEQQFLRTQRLESLGSLASGIAHDLNNVLAPILMGLELIRHQVNEPTQRTVDAMQTCASGGADLVKQVLTFARGVDGKKVSVQPRHLLQDIQKVLLHVLPKSITPVLHFHRDLWMIHGDVTQLHQVLMNLSINARDAMPSGGTLTIRAQNIHLDPAYVAMNTGCSIGPYVLIEVQDTGHGISPDIKEKVFQPFFTTKETGKGSGLGLATVASVVRNHGGFINFYSEVGCGTSFKIYFPALAVQESQSSLELPSPLPTGDGELILVVDDEVAVRDISKLTLEAHGYMVIVAQDGADGLAKYAQNSDKIHLVISDLEMPVMNGAAMIEYIQRINRHVRVISASGLASQPEPDASPLHVKLPKPYTAEQLLRTVHNLLTAV